MYAYLYDLTSTAERGLGINAVKKMQTSPKVKHSQLSYYNGLGCGFKGVPRNFKKVGTAIQNLDN